MPISRYEIRNEYSLADPDLYRASDKDDPEALLEGVAMAGLVGVLRQLGDLAEFAADIFHNLHEEVMATSSRGHGLMIRVQQLETEIPNIERAFLSQTDHSSFFDHTGVDWHPNIRIDQNLVTQGDLPRMVMDSYEECRPPPRLFLLDKFDVAGAGACLKRYSDPSFFKLENSGMTNADVVPREKKNRKAKKKGPRWKNGEMTEILPTSHTKLHQLFMEEERIENGVSNPILRANLKRRLNGFPFNKKHGESYMEKFLRPTSPDNKVVHEVTVNPSPLVSATFDYNESGLEVVGVRQVTPHRGNVGRKRSPPSSSEREQIIVNSTIDDKIRGVPSLYPSGSTIVSISSPDKEKIIAMDSHREGSLTGYQYDDIESEVDNYVDATSTVGLDTDAESSLRLKSDFTPSHVKNDSLISDANDKNLQIRSFDSQSTGDSTISDEGNNSFRKGMSSLSSDSPTTSVKNPQFEISSTLRFSCAIVDDFSVANKHSETAFSADTCPNTDAITNQKSDYEQTTSGSRVAGKGILEGTNSDKSECTLDDEDNRPNLVMDLSRSPSVSDAELHSEDGSQKSYAGKHLVDERNGERIYTVTYIHSHMANDSSNKITSDLLHWDESDREDQNSVENRAFESNLNNVHSLDKNVTPGEISSSRNLILVQVDTFLKKNIEETSPSDAQTIDAEDNHTDRYINNQISSEDLVLSHLEPSPDWPQIDSIAREIGVTLEEGTTVNEACVPVSCTTPQISPDDSEHQESSYSTPGELKESPGGEPVSMDDTKINRQEVTEISRLSDLKSLNDVHTLSKEEKSNTEDMVPAVPALSEVHILLDESDESTGADMPSPMPALSQVGPTKVAEEEIYSFEDSGLDELDNGNNSLPESHGELSLTEKVDQIKATAYGFENNDYPESEVSGSIVHNPLVDLEASDQGLEPVRPGKTQPPVEQSHLNGEHEITHQSTLENYMSDPPSIPVSDNEVEESIIPEETGLLSREISSEDPTVLPINNHQKMPDPLGSILPLSDPLSTTNLTDIPPLPPLPPSQWMMMGTLQLGSSSLLPQLSSQSAGTTDDDHASSRFGPFTASSNDGKSPLEETTHSPIQTVNEPTSKEKLQLGLVSSNGDLVKHNEVLPQLVSGLIASFDRMKNPLIRIPDEPQSNDENAKSSRVEVNSMCKDESTLQEEKAKNSHVDVSLMHETLDLPSKSENNQQSVMQTEEGGVANGSRLVKLPRPRHPLIDEFTALDKSKLRKVTERFRPPQVQKVVERDSMLEQIRTKSFNLKPALAPRPSIRGPNTNLKVAAIVEKAKAIRQALAGSDEDDDDDDDSWSDS